jgi:hypothetical protein
MFHEEPESLSTIKSFISAQTTMQCAQTLLTQQEWCQLKREKTPLNKQSFGRIKTASEQLQYSKSATDKFISKRSLKIFAKRCFLPLRR